MTINFPGPYSIRIYQTTDGIQHKLEMNLRVQGSPAPGTDWANIDALDKNDNVVSLSSIITAIEPWIESRFSLADTGFTTAELWEYEAGTFNAQYISAIALAYIPTSAFGYNPAQQDTLMFRTAEGGTMRVTLMETASTEYGEFNYASLSAVEQQFVDDVIDGVIPIIGRDTSYPIAFIRKYHGQNEKLFRKRYRS